MKNTDYIDFIVTQMQNGCIDRADILANFKKNGKKQKEHLTDIFKAAKIYIKYGMKKKMD